MKAPRWLVREVKHGEMIPRGYGIAYRSWHKDTGTAMPFGIHLIVGLARYLYFSLLWSPTAWNDAMGRREAHFRRRSR